MITTDYERLEEVRHYTRLSYPKLAESIGLKTAQTFYDIKSGKNRISKDLACKISEKFPSLSVEWLMTGEGEMIRRGNTITASGIEGENALAMGSGTTATVNSNASDLIGVINRLLDQMKKQEDDARAERARFLDIIEKLQK